MHCLLWSHSMMPYCRLGGYCNPKSRVSYWPAGAALVYVKVCRGNLYEKCWTQHDLLDNLVESLGMSSQERKCFSLLSSRGCHVFFSFAQPLLLWFIGFALSMKSASWDLSLKEMPWLSVGKLTRDCGITFHNWSSDINIGDLSPWMRARGADKHNVIPVDSSVDFGAASPDQQRLCLARGTPKKKKKNNT